LVAFTVMVPFAAAPSVPVFGPAMVSAPVMLAEGIAEVEPILRVPPLTIVAPVYVLLPVSTRVPAPLLVKPRADVANMPALSVLDVKVPLSTYTARAGSAAKHAASKMIASTYRDREVIDGPFDVPVRI
jgi:hypothetical protein